MKIESSVEKNLKFRFSGELNEKSLFKDLLETIDLPQFKNHIVDFDFSEVKSGNSMGILNWHRMVGQVSLPFFYSKAPYWLVHYFNILANFFSQRPCYVQSFYLPYYNEESDKTLLRLINVGQDIQLQADYANYKLENLNVQNVIYVPDFVPKVQFRFLTQNFDKFKKFREDYSQLII